MLTFSTWMLGASYAYMVYVFVRKRMFLASNYAAYMFFSILYSVFPILTFHGIEPSIWFAHWSLNESELLITTLALITAACNVTFAYVYQTRYRTRPSGLRPSPNGRNTIYRDIIFVAYMFTCVVLTFFGWKYSYTSGRPELINSAISNSKVLLASLYIVFLVRYGGGYRLAAMFLAFGALMVVEQSRWYFASVLFATGIYLQMSGRLKNRGVLIFVAAFALLLSYVGLYRSNVRIADLSLLLNPFYIEGDYGSYVTLQTYDLIFRGRIAFYTFFSDYLVDPVVYLIPRVFFVGLGMDKESVGMLAAFANAHQGCLLEPYTPAGGFHYLAQASSALPFFGPVIVTYALARLTVVVENNFHKSSWSSLTYYLYSSGFAFVFLKTRFDLTVKYFVTLAIPAYILFILLKRAESRADSAPDVRDSPNS